ncbi:HlyD family secretion protein [Taklimakanibacter deserti]|uniref:HlyD family secretion protein n=1 Tax=Taklimakanibacter deserti TaxID=2267839 RepID=UPI000E656F80
MTQTDVADKAGTALAPLSPPKAGVPATVLLPPATRKPRLHLWIGLALVVLAGGAVGASYWWQYVTPGLPAGIASGNGRVEADQIDIATKLGGRVAELLADEGDTVTAGQVVGRMDTADLEASLAKKKAEIRRLESVREGAKTDVDRRNTEVTLAVQNFKRTGFLFQKGYATTELLDQRQQQLDAATADLAGMKALLQAAEQALEGARHDAHATEVDIADATLVAPRDGRIQYRLANTGEVLAAGGKVFTMLDLGYVYMDLFLPTAQAGRAAVGADARIVLDAFPESPIPAKVVFVSDQAQFTPKAVETKSERDKLMFRVRIRTDNEFLRAHPNQIRAGSPGIGFVLLDATADWPAALKPVHSDAE